jgi:hypothetical protein
VGNESSRGTPSGANDQRGEKTRLGIGRVAATYRLQAGSMSGQPRSCCSPDAQLNVSTLIRVSLPNADAVVAKIVGEMKCRSYIDRWVL